MIWNISFGIKLVTPLTGSKLGMKLENDLVASAFRYTSNEIDVFGLTHAVNTASCLNFV